MLKEEKTWIKKDQPEKEQTEKEQPEKDWIKKEQIEKEQPEKGRIKKEQIEKEQPEKDRIKKDQTEKNKAEISVIVPIYRSQEYLERCVDSLLGQTYPDLEIILVDDGSDDGSPAMCDRYAREDARVRVIHKENGGLVSAWQAGVREAVGSYLCFVDSDDWVEPEMLEKMASCLSGMEQKDKEIRETKGSGEIKEIICCNFLLERSDRQTRHYHGLVPGVYEGDRLEQEVKDSLLGYENRRISMSRCMKLFSRSLIEDNMKYCDPKITMGEDVNITLPALLDCQRVVIMEEALYYHYFHHRESMAHCYEEKLYQGIQTLYHVICDIFEKKGRKNGQDQAEGEYVYLLFLVLKNEIRSGKKDYAAKIRRICRENREVVKKRKIAVCDKANLLLYLILRCPNRCLIAGTKAVFRLYDRYRQ